MLLITIAEAEVFDEGQNKFLTLQGGSLLLEHSLVSLSKWEAKHGVPFLNGKTKSTLETQSYVSCMNLSPVYGEGIYTRLSNDNLQEISDYIGSKQTATWFKEDPSANRPSSEIVTSEIIYYWMIAHSIPLDAQYWHLTKLLTLIKVCNEKNKPAQRSKMGTRDQIQSRRMLNAQRKAELKTTG